MTRILMIGVIGPSVAERPSPTVFVAKVIFAAIAIVLAIALVAAAPGRVTIPLAVVFGTGMVATGLVAWVDRWRERRHVPNAHDPTVSSRVSGRAALAAASTALLALALIVPENVGGALVAVGIVGLLALRVEAMHRGWPPRGAALLGSR